MRPPVGLLLLLPFVSVHAAAGEDPLPRAEGAWEGDAQADAGGATATSNISLPAQGDGENITNWSTNSDGTDEDPPEVNFSDDAHNVNEQEVKFIDTESYQEDDDANLFMEHDNTNTNDDRNKEDDRTFGNYFLKLNKCCEKGEYFVHSICKKKPGAQWKNVKYDYFNTPINDTSTYWIPEILRYRPIYAKYVFRYLTVSAVLEANEENINTFLGVKSNKTLLDKSSLQGRLHPSLIKYNDSCLEATDDISRPLVLVVQWKLFRIDKCCGKRESLVLEGYECIKNYENQSEYTGNEVVDIKKDSASAIWLPRSIQKYIFEVRYYTRPEHEWNVIIDADEEEWRFVPGGSESRIWFRDSSDTNGSTPLFCFDSVHGKPEKHILAARLVHMFKCCKYGEELNSRLDRCVPKPGFKADNSIYGILDLAKTNYWYPQQNTSNKIKVQYDHFQDDDNAAFSTDLVNWKYNFYDGEPLLILEYSTPTNKYITVTTEDFCFDSVSSGAFAPHVIITWDDNISLGFLKCCPRGEVLTADGNCIQHDRKDLSPLTSIISRLLDHNNLYQNDIHDLGDIYRLEYEFNVDCKFEYRLNEAEISELGHEKWVSPFVTLEDFMTKIYCADLLRNDDGSEQETLAYCEVPSNAWLYKRVRPLQVVAAALLGAAVAVAVARGQTRRSVHGRALACHAACLTASNALQVAWFFTHKPDKNCDYFAYAIYFFLMGSSLWMNVVTFNMARGFSLQQVGPSAIRAESRVWILFGVYSIYAWGTSVALTAASIYMHIYALDMKEGGYVTPSFFETRTCFSELAWEISYRGLEDQKSGSLLYFYVPSTILVVVNIICLVTTLCKIRYLRRGTSYLNTPRSLQNALVYVKLLLTAGIVELAVEASAWATKKDRKKRTFLVVYPELTSGYYAGESTYRLVIILTFVDVARAAAVLWLCVGSWRKVARGLWLSAGRWLQCRLRRCAGALARLLNCPTSGRDRTLPLSPSPNTSSITETATTRL